MLDRLRKAELEHDSGSEEDDDAPEEVTLSSGREKAQELRKEERENQKRIHAEAKQRRQRNIVKKTEESPSDKQEDAPVAESLEGGVNPAQDDHEFKLSKSGKISGFLDPSIVDFVSAQEKKVGEASASPPEDENLQTRKRTGKRKGNKEIISSSRVKVVILEGDRPSSANYQNALEFKQKRLHGERVHRSLDMLRN